MSPWFRAWEFTAESILKIPRTAPPDVVFFDNACVYTSPRGRLAWRAAPHEGMVTLPDGNRIPIQVTSFASASDGRPFFVMAAPDVWIKAGVTSAQFGRDRLLTAVFLHEFAHVRQMPGLERILAPIDKAWRFPQELTDDVIQQRFGSDAAYEAAYQQERDLLYRAAAARSNDEARALAAQALALMQARHAKWFTGENEVFRVLDDVFLSFEGAGQWVAYAWLVDPRGGGAARDAALTGMRRGGRSWSQDQGLALFLVVDRMLPEWPVFVFGPESIGARDLLDRALLMSP